MFGRGKSRERERQIDLDTIAELNRENSRLDSDASSLRSYTHGLEASLAACGDIASTTLAKTKDWGDDEGARYVRAQLIEIALRSGLEP